MKRKNKNKQISKEMYKGVPDDVKIAFGKFYLFSCLYILFFVVIYPFLLMNHLSDFSNGLVIGFFSIFYLYILRDTKNRIKSFVSNFYYILMFFVIVSISFSIVKYFI